MRRGLVAGGDRVLAEPALGGPVDRARAYCPGRANQRWASICTTGASPNPTFNLTSPDSGYIVLPVRQHHVHVGLCLRGFGSAVPAPGPGAVRQPGRHCHRDHCSTRCPSRSRSCSRQENVLANGAPAQPEFDGPGTITSLTNTAAPRRQRHLQLCRHAARAPSSTSPAPTPRSRCGMGLFGALIVRPTQR